MSQLLEAAARLDPQRAVDLVRSDGELVPPQRYYRVQGDWHGGGFGYTLPFSDADQAAAWGRDKAHFHRDAVITVIDRGPVPRDPAAAADVERNFDKGEKLAARDMRAAAEADQSWLDAMRRAGAV